MSLDHSLQALIHSSSNTHKHSCLVSYNNNHLLQHHTHFNDYTPPPNCLVLLGCPLTILSSLLSCLVYHRNQALLNHHSLHNMIPLMITMVQNLSYHDDKLDFSPIKLPSSGATRRSFTPMHRNDHPLLYVRECWSWLPINLRALETSSYWVCRNWDQLSPPLDNWKFKWKQLLPEHFQKRKVRTAKG